MTSSSTDIVDPPLHLESLIWICHFLLLLCGTFVMLYETKPIVPKIIFILFDYNKYIEILTNEISCLLIDLYVHRILNESHYYY